MIDRQLWKKDRFLQSLQATLEQLNLLSLDIFDTVLFRKVSHPSDVFTIVGERALTSFYMRSGRTPIEFKHIRMLAEKAARKDKLRTTGSDEVTLSEIYAQMPITIGERERICELEFEAEKQCCYPNPSILSLISQAADLRIPIVLVSDTYFSSAQIRSLLETMGVSMQCITEIMVSCEYGVGKANGQLFKKLLHKYDFDVQTICHIGDNFAADIEGAQECGIGTIYYNVVPYNVDSIYQWEKICHGEFLPEILSLRKLAGYLGEEQWDSPYFEIGASVVGPFLCAFADWVVSTCIREKRRCVLALMREGHLLAPLIERAAEFYDYRLEVHPLFVSRQSTFLAGLSHFGEEQMHMLLERSHLTIENLLDMLGLYKQISHFEQYKEVPVAESGYIETEGTSLRNILVDFILQPPQLDLINENINIQRLQLHQYLDQTSQYCSDAVTVDLGFKGTIQASLENSFKLKNINTSFIHLLGIGSIHTRDHLHLGIDIRGFVGSSGENYDLIKTIMRSPEVLESLLMGVAGTTLGYRTEQDGTVIPVCESKNEDQLELNKKQTFEKGVFTFQRLWHFYSPHPVGNKRDWCKLVHRLVEMPTLQEATAIGDIWHDYGLGSRFSTKIISESDRKKADEQDLENFIKVCSHGYHATGVFWPQGAATLIEPSYLFSKYLERYPDDSYLSVMNSLVSSIKSKGIMEIIIYGAGDVGKSLLRVAAFNQLQVRCIVDRKRSLWGQKVDDVEITSLDQAIAFKLDVYAVASLSFAKEIKHDLEERYKKEGRHPLIFVS